MKNLLYNYKNLIIIILLFTFPLLSFGRGISVQNITDLKKTYPGEIMTYTIINRIDLHNTKIKLPENCVIQFKTKGQIINGTLIGTNSKIVSDRRTIFRNIEIEGNWSNEIVYSEWVCLNNGKISNNKEFKALMQLCNGNNLTHFYLQKGKYYVSSINASAPILVPSNVYWHNEATIEMLPSKYEKYSIIQLIASNNVIIDGGKFIGDVETHVGAKGEWGHGIKCSGATNITLKNLECSYCWGDGIDLIEGFNQKNNKYDINCNNIKIENVKCLYNRRQGLSIEAAFNVIIDNSEFAYTGMEGFTPPGAGVDIEPWNNDNEKIKNISFKNCSFHNNKGADFINFANCQMGNNYESFNNYINLDNCKMQTAIIRQCCGTIIKNSEILTSLYVLNATDINIYDTYIKKYIPDGIVGKITFHNCRGDLSISNK